LPPNCLLHSLLMMLRTDRVRWRGACLSQRGLPKCIAERRSVSLRE
jgi:hypothetical protein